MAHMPLASDKELVQIVNAALADAARRAGAWLVCKPGCTQCCYGAFAVDELDAQRLTAGMQKLRSENSALAADVEHRALDWIQKHGSTFPGNLETGILGDTGEDLERFETYANEPACPALNPATGHCDVYEWRPMTCRVFGPPVRMGAGNSLGHCDLCFHGATAEDVEACEMKIPQDLEQELNNKLPANGETVVAFALLH
jgi:Fe-S-cluster containining protein